MIVADNASTDGSAEYVRSAFPELRVIGLDSNYGFTGGYNRALAQIEAEYYVLINSDVDAPKGWLGPLVEWMDTHPDCAVCGPKIHALDPEGFGRTDRFEYAGAAGGWLDRFCYPFCRGRVLSRTEQDCGQYDSPAAVQWVSGACMMVRSSVWKELGGLDDRFFAHMEEIDFCCRATAAGYCICVVPQSCVWHLGGGTLPQSSPLKLKLNYRNTLLLMQKIMPAWRIFMRKVFDGGSALVYLVSGNRAGFRAVLDAHRQARELQAEGPQTRYEFKPGPMDGIRIIPLSFLKGRRVFKYLRHYEDSHCRCR